MTIEALAAMLAYPTAPFCITVAAAFEAGMTLDDVRAAIELALAKKEPKP
jgi:hypothetical protein